MGDGLLYNSKFKIQNSRLMSIEEIKKRAAKIKLMITDVDGVLTDNGVYYSGNGEELKRFSFRDGMGVERLRKIAGIETGIITKEDSLPVAKRSEKLKISELHMGVNDKALRLKEIMNRIKISTDEIAYIGDDINDEEIMKQVGLSACSADAMSFARKVAHYVCTANGGHGAFREFAELIINSKK
jgi:3-deoxy-D-manno-octulosonate 8-phosphate phosphatase (KDO 8-P phosphatase)